MEAGLPAACQILVRFRRELEQPPRQAWAWGVTPEIRMNTRLLRMERAGLEPATFGLQRGRRLSERYSESQRTHPCGFTVTLRDREEVDQS